MMRYLQPQQTVANVSKAKAHDVSTRLASDDTRCTSNSETDCNGAYNNKSNSALIKILHNWRTNEYYSGYVKRKVHASWLVLLFSLVVILESNVVLGALSNLNYNDTLTNEINNYNYTVYGNSTYAAELPQDYASDAATMAAGDSIAKHNAAASSNESQRRKLGGRRLQAIYQNEFALYVPGGTDKANEVADKYGFTNMGQVSEKKFRQYSLFTLEKMITQIIIDKSPKKVFRNIP